MMVMGCRKIIETPQKPTTTKITSYLQVTCENCNVIYGMPDQYKSFDNAGGLSVKYPYTYKEGYNLQVQVTPEGKSQNLTLQVYDKSGNVVYNGAATRDAAAIWGITVLLTENK